MHFLSLYTRKKHDCVQLAPFICIIKYLLSPISFFHAYIVPSLIQVCYSSGSNIFYYIFFIKKLQIQLIYLHNLNFCLQQYSKNMFHYSQNVERAFLFPALLLLKAESFNIKSRKYIFCKDGVFNDFQSLAINKEVNINICTNYTL